MGFSSYICCLSIFRLYTKRDKFNWSQFANCIWLINSENDEETFAKLMDKLYTPSKELREQYINMIKLCVKKCLKKETIGILEDQIEYTKEFIEVLKNMLDLQL